jgi:hypothetical protein
MRILQPGSPTACAECIIPGEEHNPEMSDFAHPGGAADEMDRPLTFRCRTGALPRRRLQGYQGDGRKGRAMGRARFQHHHRRYRRRGPFRRWPPKPLLILLAVALTAAGIFGLVAIFVLMVLTPLILTGIGTVAVIRYLGGRHRRAVKRQQRESMPARTSTSSVTRTVPGPDWHATRTRFAQLRSEYAQFECDPLAVLRLPALTDVTVPSTGRFVDAFAEAQALDTDAEPSDEHRDRYARAVDQAWCAWHAARDAAERIRLSRIPAEEHATVHRAIKLLTMARDSDHDAERIAAYVKARAELAKLERSGTLRMPPAAAAALDAAARAQLPAAKP